MPRMPSSLEDTNLHSLIILTKKFTVPFWDYNQKSEMRVRNLGKKVGLELDSKRW